MSLFTSSSRKIYFKTLMAILVGMTLSMALIRLLSFALDASPEMFLGRVLQAQAALPKILEEPEDLVMFYGSSMVQAGISPRQFDAALNSQGAKIKSFNFGFGGLNPLFQDYLARRIKEAFQKEDRRLKLALIEFNPFQATITRRNRARASEDSFLGLLASQKEMFDLTLKDPEKGLRLYNIRYLRNGISAEMTTHFFGEGFQEQPQPSPIPEDEAMAKKRRELGQEINKRFEQDYPDYVPSRWSYEWQGAGTIASERSADTLRIVEEYYATLLTPHRMDNARLRRIRTADIIDLNFDEELVVSFIEIVKQFQAFSDKVEVILLPKNTQWIKCPPEALQGMQIIMDRIAAETGVTVRNFQEIEAVNPTMFRDATHLNRYVGSVAFTDFLVAQYAHLFR